MEECEDAVVGRYEQAGPNGRGDRRRFSSPSPISDVSKCDRFSLRIHPRAALTMDSEHIKKNIAYTSDSHEILTTP